VRLRARAPGKVNLCLFLGGPRADGRHELITLFESVSLADELVLETGVSAADEVRCEGIAGPNLVSVALRALRECGWTAPPVRVTISKRIPVAAGMGGGSADAAALLRIAQRLRAVPDEVLCTVAAELGADVPSQVSPGLVLGEGAGELVTAYPPLPAHTFVFVPQLEPLATADVYREADRLGLRRASDELAARRGELAEALAAGGTLPPDLLVNDLEPAALSLRPQIAQALDYVRDAGAERAFVCGSGPTVAGLYWGRDAVERARAVLGALAERLPLTSAASPVSAEFGYPVVA
jgi:4-diphosphocytidyl-2-C-methyl-D-erythritol kinase